VPGQPRIGAFGTARLRVCCCILLLQFATDAQARVVRRWRQWDSVPVAAVQVESPSDRDPITLIFWELAPAMVEPDAGQLPSQLPPMPGGAPSA
jgi:hypothetical protein